LGQTCLSLVPHTPQNVPVSGLSLWQLEQFILSVPSQVSMTAAPTGRRVYDLIRQFLYLYQRAANPIYRFSFSRPASVL
jgi:hypothetical protein